jgi:hypothetical protein
MNVFDPMVMQLVNAAPDPSIYLRPMSKDARIALSKVLGWSVQWVSSHKFGGIAAVMAEISKEFDPISYEQAVQQYMNFAPKLTARTPSSIKKVSDGVDIVMLRPLQSPAWVSTNELKNNPYRVGLISSEAPASTYRWLTRNYLLHDFTMIELNKICEIGMSFPIETISAAANSVSDPDKKTVAYVYAILQSNAQANVNQVKQEAGKQEAQIRRLAKAYEKSLSYTNKPTHEVDRDELQKKWTRTNEFIDILDKLYK